MFEEIDTSNDRRVTLEEFKKAKQSRKQLLNKKTGGAAEL